MLMTSQTMKREKLWNKLPAHYNHLSVLVFTSIYNTPSSFQAITALDIKFSRIDSLAGVVIQIVPFSYTEENMDIIKYQTHRYLCYYYY